MARQPRQSGAHRRGRGLARQPAVGAERDRAAARSSSRASNGGSSCTWATSASGRTPTDGTISAPSARRWPRTAPSSGSSTAITRTSPSSTRSAATCMPDGRVPVRPGIFHLPRGHRWAWHGRRWLACGGGVSLDKACRREGSDWWPQEEITDEQERALVGGGVADVMVCHDCPAVVDHSFPRPPCGVEPGRPGAQRRAPGAAAADRRRREAALPDARAPAPCVPAGLRLRLRARPGDRVRRGRRAAELRRARRVGDGLAAAPRTPGAGATAPGWPSALTAAKAGAAPCRGCAVRAGTGVRRGPRGAERRGRCAGGWRHARRGRSGRSSTA